MCSRQCSLRVCLVDADKGVRCQVLRLIRYFLAADDAHRKSAARASDLIGHSSTVAAAAPNTLSLACELERYNFGVFLSRSLERDGKHMWERMQVGNHSAMKHTFEIMMCVHESYNHNWLPCSLLCPYTL